jgi:hypothetical protein
MTPLAKFFDDVSENDWLKLGIVAASFIVLGIPAAVLLSIGAPEKVVFPRLIFCVLPIQYVAYLVFQARPVLVTHFLGIVAGIAIASLVSLLLRDRASDLPQLNTTALIRTVSGICAVIVLFVLILRMKKKAPR